MKELLEKLTASPEEKTFRLKARLEAAGPMTLWSKQTFLTCPHCERRATRQRWSESLYVCPNCGTYQPIGGYYRLSLLFDHGSFHELSVKTTQQDPLHFPGYAEKLSLQKRKTGLSEAAITATGRIGGMPVVAAVLDSRFFMGSMSAGVGERVTQAVEYASAKKWPLIIFSASGGARMQEGIFSLMQMAKTSAAIAEFSARGGLYISFLTHPTTGGVTASFASLGDIMLAEPGALIGFAGPRVIRQTLGIELPEGFQTSEYLQDHGFVDKIVPRSELRDTMTQLLRLHAPKGQKV